MCLVAWPLNEREAGVDLDMIETHFYSKARQLSTLLIVRLTDSALSFDSEEEFRSGSSQEFKNTIKVSKYNTCILN